MGPSKPLVLDPSRCLTSKVYDGFVVNSTPCVVKTEDLILLQHEHRIWSHLQHHGYEPISQGLVEAMTVPFWGHTTYRPTTGLALRKGNFFHFEDQEPTTHGLDLVVALTSYVGYCLVNCLKLMHREGVLHRDIHPGNVMIVEQPWQPKPLQSYEPSLPYTALLVDFGHSLLNGEHPTVPSNVPIGHPVYSAHGVGEALAYTLITIRRGAFLPWDVFEYNLDIPLASIPTSRDDAIEGLLEGLECSIRNFVLYARSLLPESEIDYDFWSAQFWNEFVAMYEARPETRQFPSSCKERHLQPVHVIAKIAVGHVVCDPFPLPGQTPAPH
ncbi:hypothetical protein LXA43DRAFT_64020 [Ganoderma leucocontextum]|nr:hypothetical protein LXA43DRAFT_64020 [Ganoderma leucocontextum]